MGWWIFLGGVLLGMIIGIIIFALLNEAHEGNRDMEIIKAFSMGLNTGREIKNESNQRTTGKV